ncbi:MAG: hypothetical protein R2864_08145 [Syntrophotaleaceae bacterium]
MTLVDTTTFGQYATDAPDDLLGYGGRYVNKLEHLGDYVSWKHQFTFVPAAQEILSGSLSLFLKDNDREGYFFGFIPFGFELGLGVGEDGSWDIGEIDTGEYQYDVNVDFSRRRIQGHLEVPFR